MSALKKEQIEFRKPSATKSEVKKVIKSAFENAFDMTDLKSNDFTWFSNKEIPK